MHKPLPLILVAVVLLLVGTLSAVAADAPAGSTAPVPLDAEAVLRKVELTVGLKNYEKVLAAKFEAEFELQLGPPDSMLPPEQKVAWTEAQTRKRDLLTKLAVELREQIKGWIAAENSSAQAKGEVKAVPAPVIINRAFGGHQNASDHDDRDLNVPKKPTNATEVHGVQANAEAKSPVVERLKVTVKPAVTTIHLQELFKVALRVENTTQETQTIKVMSCGWYDHWKCDDARVTFGGPDCKDTSPPEDVAIAPGEANTKELEMCIPGAPPGKLQFRMGFTPIDSPKTYWSDPVEVEVKAQ